MGEAKLGGKFTNRFLSSCLFKGRLCSCSVRSRLDRSRFGCHGVCDGPLSSEALGFLLLLGSQHCLLPGNQLHFSPRDHSSSTHKQQVGVVTRGLQRSLRGVRVCAGAMTPTPRPWTGLPCFGSVRRQQVDTHVVPGTP